MILTKHAQNLHPPTLPVVRKRRMELPTTTLQLLQSSRMLAVCCHIVIPNVQTANIQVQCQSQLNSKWACVYELGILGVSVGGLENWSLNMVLAMAPSFKGGHIQSWLTDKSLLALVPLRQNKIQMLLLVSPKLRTYCWVLPYFRKKCYDLKLPFESTKCPIVTHRTSSTGFPNQRVNAVETCTCFSSAKKTKGSLWWPWSGDRMMNAKCCEDQFSRTPSQWIVMGRTFDLWVNVSPSKVEVNGHALWLWGHKLLHCTNSNLHKELGREYVDEQMMDCKKNCTCRRVPL